MTPEMEARFDGLAAFADWMNEERKPRRCYWIHCIYGCDLVCDHTELCYASRGGGPCVTADAGGVVSGERDAPVVLDLDDPYFHGQALPDILRDYEHVHSATGVCVKAPNGQFCARPLPPAEPRTEDDA